MARDTQLNIRTNHELLADVKRIVATEHMDMTTFVNNIFQMIQEKGEIPIELSPTKERERQRIIDSLYSEIEKGRADFLAGKSKTIDEIGTKYGL